MLYLWLGFNFVKIKSADFFSNIVFLYFLWVFVILCLFKIAWNYPGIPRWGPGWFRIKIKNFWPPCVRELFQLTEQGFFCPKHCKMHLEIVFDVRSPVVWAWHYEQLENGYGIIIISILLSMLLSSPCVVLHFSGMAVNNQLPLFWSGRLQLPVQYDFFVSFT